MTLRKLACQGIGALALGTFFATLPVAASFNAGAGFDFSIAKAFAKDGAEDGGGGSGGGNSNSGSGSSGGHSGNDGGGGGGKGGSDDNGSGGNDDNGGGGNDDNGGGRGNDDNGGTDDNGAGGGASDDGPGDDNGGRGRGADDGGASANGGGAPAAGGVRVVKFERTATAVEVVYSNGVKEEIANGRFEMKNAAGRTVAERPATRKDLARLDANVRNSGIVPVPTGSQAAKVEVAGGAIEVTYTTGWKEELATGRYELKDPNNNTVVQRPATAADIQRLRALAGS